MHKIIVGTWRTGKKGSMQVVSDAIGKEKVHYEAPEADKANEEMTTFLSWFNQS